MNHGAFRSDLHTFHNLDGTGEPGADGLVFLFDFHDAKLARCRRCESMMEAEVRYPDVFFIEYEQKPFSCFSMVLHTVDNYFNHDVPAYYPSAAVPLVEAMAWA